MHKNRFYILLILAAVICASVFLYAECKDQWEDSWEARQNQPADHTAALFPDPGKTGYRMQLYLDTNTRTLYGTTLLTTRNTTGKSMRELWFTVYPNCFRTEQSSPAPAEAYYKGFNPGNISFDSFQVNGEPAEIRGQGSSLRVKLPSKLLPGCEIKVEMRWKVLIPQLKYRFGSTDTLYMLGNFYPALNVYDKDGWHNAYNSRFGDPFCFHCADYQVVLNIPSGYHFVSSGKTVDAQAEDNGREFYLIEAENARDFCLLVMYDYTEIEQKTENISVKCCFPGTQIYNTEQLLNQSAQILNYYASRFGSYPYAEFKTVIVPMQGFHGMEYSGLIMLQEDMFKSAAGQQNSQFILAHEIAHQWWYGLVGNDQLKEPWLDEGLANWSAYQYLHDRRGQALPVLNPDSSRTKLDQALADINSRQDYYLTAYRGGEAFWFGLEEQLGHEAVLKVLQAYLAEYQYEIASTKDLIKIIRQEAGDDQSMDAFLQQWFASEENR